MFKTELLTRKDWIKIAILIVILGALVFGGLFWILELTATSELY